jgi:PAS domain S-box-containing protein
MQVGLRLIGGLAVAGLVLAGLVGEHAATVITWLMVVIVLAWLALERWVHRPLRASARYGQALLNGAAATLAAPPAGADWRGSVAALEALADARRDEAKALASERAARQVLEQRLQETEERYAMAVRGASDGLWEWNTRTDNMHLSPRWKNMLGFRDSEIPDTLEGWKSRLHPDDRAAVEAKLAEHLGGATEKFESEHRVVHRDGTHRWMLSRGMALRHANGAVYRVVGLDTDVSRMKRMEELMLHVAAGTASATGRDFFRELVKNFALSLGVRIAFVTECVDQPATRVRALAFWKDGTFVDGVEYDLAGTPCKQVFDEGVTTFHPRDVATLFPIEKGKDFESYFGVPICDASRRVIGHLAFFDNKEMDAGVLLEPVYRIFAARAAAELERMRTANALLDLSERLYGVRGEPCLRELVRSFAQHLGVREAFVCECVDEPTTRVRMLAHWNRGTFAPNAEFDLAGTTCERVIGEARPLFVPEAVGEQWPRERQYERESYLGLPCLDAQGRVIGHIACMDGRAMRRALPDQAILRLFAERAALELERRRLTALTYPARADAR